MFISDNDIKFACEFSKFVNGKMHSPKVVAAQMTRDHRYLQNEMFKICFEYIRFLAMNYVHNDYDDRNKWACMMADKMFNSCSDIYGALNDKDWEDYQNLRNQLYLKTI